MAIYQIINMAGKHRVKTIKTCLPDDSGRVPVWDLTDECWRLVNMKWLQEITPTLPKKEVKYAG